jgi:chromosome partitioning protein
VHLATAATLAGFDAVVIDLDPQASAATWGDDRGDAAPEVVSGEANRLPVLIDGARQQGFDLVVIDTGPNADAAACRAAELADLVLIPCRPAAFDLKAIRTTIDLVEITRSPAFVIINAAPFRSSAVQEVCDVVTGLGAKVAQAAEETAALWAWVAGELDLPPTKAAKAA